MLESSSQITDWPLHIELEFNKKVMSVCESESQCHPEATYWLPVANLDRLFSYLRMSKLTQIHSIEHFTKVLTGRIVQQLKGKT